MSPTSWRTQSTPSANQRSSPIVELAGARTLVLVPMLKEKDLIGTITHLPPGGPSL